MAYRSVKTAKRNIGIIKNQDRIWPTGPDDKGINYL